MHVKIITSLTCWYCDKAKSLLKANNQPYEEVDLDEEEAFDLMAQYKCLTVPQLFIDGELLPGGYEGLKAYYEGKDDK